MYVLVDVVIKWVELCENSVLLLKHLVVRCESAETVLGGIALVQDNEMIETNDMLERTDVGDIVLVLGKVAEVFAKFSDSDTVERILVNMQLGLGEMQDLVHSLNVLYLLHGDTVVDV